MNPLKRTVLTPSVYRPEGHGRLSPVRSHEAQTGGILDQPLGKRNAKRHRLGGPDHAGGFLDRQWDIEGLRKG